MIAEESDEGHPGFVCEVDGQRRGSRHGSQNRDAGHDCSLGEFERGTPTYEQNSTATGETVVLSCPTDDLVDGIVPPDVLAQGEEFAGGG